MKRILLTSTLVLFSFFASVNANTLNISPKNLEKLDRILSQLEIQKSKYSSQEKYFNSLKKLSAKLTMMKIKYKNNSDVVAMISYLDDGVDQLLEKQTTTNLEVDDFFCDLSENSCEKNISLLPKKEQKPTTTLVVKVSAHSITSGSGANYPSQNNSPQTNDSSSGEVQQNGIIQGMYRLTQKNYSGDFMKGNDVCSSEFGNDWSISNSSIDAHIMTTKNQKAWFNINNSACSNYTSTSGETGIFYLNNQITKNIGCNNQMPVVCHKAPATQKENYLDILTPVTKSQRDNFMKQIDTELASKITSDNNFIYLNNYLAISKQVFTGIQLYKDSSIQACPSGYSLAQYEYDGKTNNIASPYTLQVLGNYLSKNPSAYQFLEQKEVGNQYAHDYRFWKKQDSWDDNYMNKFDEKKIVEDKKTLSAFQVRMHNAYLNIKLPAVDPFYYIDNTFGTSDSAEEKRPTLCQKNDTKDNFSQLPGNMKKYDGEIIINQGSAEADSFVQYAYQRVLAGYNGGGDELYQYFLPISQDGGYYFYNQSKE